MDILDRAIELLGPPVRIEKHRGWGIWWCPFHPDEERRGKRGRPNFGINLKKGYWRCFVCGASGPSLRALARALGEDWKPPKYDHKPRKRTGPALSLVTYALAECRAAFRNTPAAHYVAVERKIPPHIAALYGLGYGLPYPPVPPSVVQAAQKAHMVTKRGWWLWAGGVVYAEPPTSPPVFIQVRHLRSKAPSKYQTWGTLWKPGGAWLVSEETEALIVAEGLFDMLALATVLHALSLLPRVVPVYTVGGGSADQLNWLRTQSLTGRKIYLIPDPDPGGDAWAERIRERVRVAGVLRPPEGRDPDEAVLEDGWWPFRF